MILTAIVVVACSSLSAAKDACILFHSSPTSERKGFSHSDCLILFP